VEIIGLTLDGYWHVEALLISISNQVNRMLGRSWQTLSVSVWRSSSNGVLCYFRKDLYASAIAKSARRQIQVSWPPWAELKSSERTLGDDRSYFTTGKKLDLTCWRSWTNEWWRERS